MILFNNLTLQVSAKLIIPNIVGQQLNKSFECHWIIINQIETSTIFLDAAFYFSGCF